MPASMGAKYKPILVKDGNSYKIYAYPRIPNLVGADSDMSLCLRGQSSGRWYSWGFLEKNPILGDGKRLGEMRGNRTQPLFVGHRHVGPISRIKNTD